MRFKHCVYDIICRKKSNQKRFTLKDMIRLPSMLWHLTTPLLQKVVRISLCTHGLALERDRLNAPRGSILSVIRTGDLPRIAHFVVELCRLAREGEIAPREVLCWHEGIIERCKGARDECEIANAWCNLDTL